MSVYVVTKPEKLETALARAEAALAPAIVNSDNGSARWTKADLKRDYVHVYCRRLRTELVELDDSESTADIDKVRAYCRELRTVFLELNPSATIPFRCLEPSCDLLRLPRTTCWRNYLEGAIAQSRRSDTSSECSVTLPPPSTSHAIHPFNTECAVQESRTCDARLRPYLLRQAIGFLTLVLAYLAYFHVDVQLQILSLPSIFP